MLKSSARSIIRLRGVRHNNLKNFDLDLPLNRLIVITGLSGSGKSSLAFDTLFAEGQRRYIETFSPYARQFFDRMDKPQVDSIEGIPPAIAIEQRNAVKTTRSTVGTMTEICEYMKLLWPHVAQLHCRQCGQPVCKESPQQIWEALRPSGLQAAGAEVLITFDLPLSDKLSLQDSLGLIAKQGYQRLLLNGEIIRLEHLQSAGELTPAAGSAPHPATSLTVVQDRLRVTDAARPRFVEACEQAYHFGKGKLVVHELGGPASAAAAPAGRSPARKHPFSNRYHCARCDLEYREATPALFSFNNPLGACPKCRGFGRVISIDYNLALPDRSKTLAGGAIKPWQSGQSADCQRDLMRMCRHFEIPTDVPFDKLPRKWQDFVIQGEPNYGTDEEHEWPRAWYGIKGYFRWLESRAYKMHVRVLLSRYRAYTECPDCLGKRFQPEALLYRAGLDLAEFYQLAIRDALGFIAQLAGKFEQKRNDPLGLALNEVRSRLQYLDEVGLGYLTLDRPTRSLSGGETERVNLTTCLGTRLVNTLFVLDEPSVGLHSRDTDRLVRILERLRDAGNTVVVVEHEPSVMRAADHIIDLGPGHGATGGQVVFQGDYSGILKSGASLTGQYLSGQKTIEIPPRRPVALEPLPSLLASSKPNASARSASQKYSNGAERIQRLSARRDANQATGRVSYATISCQTGSEAMAMNDALAAPAIAQPACGMLKLEHASLHNLKDVAVEIPLGRFVCVTGVSGSGKTTLIRQVLLPAMLEQLRLNPLENRGEDTSTGETNGSPDEAEAAASPARGVVLTGADQLGAVLLVDQSILAKTPRSNPAVYIGAFDDIRDVFAQSDLARKRGFAPGMFSFNSTSGQCERCRGAGYEKIEMQFLSDVFIRCPDCKGRRYLPRVLEIKLGSHSIADVLDSSVEQAIAFLSSLPDSRPAARAIKSLKLLEEVGLGYLKVGQPINTLSGGESQRLKLVKHLAEALAGAGSGSQSGQSTGPHARWKAPGNGGLPARGGCVAPTLFLFDEPTTGLHFDDVRVLLKVFQRLVDGGNSVLVIEHNLEVIKSADWLIDLGPDAGDQGGQLVAQGTPEQVAACAASHTGKALSEVLEMSVR